MSSEIKIEILATETSIEDLIGCFQNQLGILADAMDFDVANFDERAQIDQVQIRNAEVDGDSISLTYELRFSAYYGCSELNYAGHHQRTLLGRRDGGFWIFPQQLPLPSRSTLEEF